MSYKEAKQYRLTGHDYSQKGSYFITLNTKNREEYFGQIIENAMNLSEIGKYIEFNFQLVKAKIDYLNIDKYVIMPNHLHLIITIKNTKQKIEAINGLSPLAKKSISSFCNHLKGGITLWCNENNVEFSWQARFHDRIIRNEREYYRIKRYIQNNVASWENDKENRNFKKNYRNQEKYC
ncbi:MAG: transposase [Bacteroidota bacterium]